MNTVFVITRKQRTCLEIEKVVGEKCDRVLCNSLSITKQYVASALEAERISVLLNEYAGLLYRKDYKVSCQDLLNSIKALAEGKLFLLVDRPTTMNEGDMLIYTQQLLSVLVGARLKYI